MATASVETPFHTSGNVRLTKPQLVGTLTGLLLAMLLAALDQTIVGTAETRIIASLSGFNRYPWVATAYMLTSTIGRTTPGRAAARQPKQRCAKRVGFKVANQIPVG